MNRPLSLTPFPLVLARKTVLGSARQFQAPLDTPQPLRQLVYAKLMPHHIAHLIRCVSPDGNHCGLDRSQAQLHAPEFLVHFRTQTGDVTA